MSEYIKKEDAIKEIKEWATNLLDPRYIVREDAECALMDLPSADVVEVVRCKDCRFGEWRSGIGYICGIRRLMDEHGIDGEGFCALGAREDGEEE